MDVFFSLYKDATQKGLNMASSHGVQLAIIRSHVHFLEWLLENSKIQKDTFLRSQIEKEIAQSQRAQKTAEYFWDHRDEGELTFEEVLKRTEDQSKVA